MAQSCSSPASHTNAIPFQEKYVVVALWTLLLADIWRVFWYGIGCRGEQEVSQLSNAREVWTQPLFPWIQECLGPNNTLDCSFTWPQENLTLGQKCGYRSVAKDGFGGSDCFHLPVRGLYGLKGLCSLLRKGQFVWVHHKPLRVVASCCCSVSLVVSGALTWPDTVLLCRFVFPVVLKGPGRVLLLSVKCFSQRTVSQWCFSLGWRKGWGWMMTLWVLVAQEPSLTPCKLVDAWMLYFL